MSVIGLDVGTSRVKAVRFDADWASADGEGEATKVVSVPGGGREQHMPEVWSAAADVVRTVAQRSPDPIDLVAVTAQGDGCWLVDDDLQPVGNAILWNDARAGGIVDEWQRDGSADAAFRISGCAAAPGTANAQLRWLAAERPQALDAAATLLSCGSWVFANLTGRRVLEETDAANPFFGARERGYRADLLELYGIAELRRLLPDAVRGADRIAALTADAAQRCGLRAGTPVALAPYDVAATAVGTGVVGTGESFAVLGTTLCVGTVQDQPYLDRPANGITLPGVADERWLLAYPTMCGTEVLDWCASLLGLADAATVVRHAAQSTHPRPPLVLPYLSPAGERNPFLDADVRGTITALELGHRPADVARGALEGLTMAVLDCLQAAGMPQSLALSGGGSRSELWCQAISDATGARVVRPDVDEVGARGAVLVGAADAGKFADVDAAVAQVVRPGITHEPNPEMTEYFRTRYDEFVTARDALRG
ncbi:FGGY family carbohydrate kinase [uncultured Jatrophihabitans sp.]|uniref:FGGY family carbohydrate kinase n=1 Tax=uncultured Jatrophihabitans sp. TaxID=1610747 RepID=UPI0035CC7FC3